LFYLISFNAFVCEIEAEIFVVNFNQLH